MDRHQRKDYIMSQRRFTRMPLFIAVFMGVGIGMFLDKFQDSDSLISHAQENSRETVILDMNHVTVPSTDVKRSIDFYWYARGDPEPRRDPMRTIALIPILLFASQVDCSGGRIRTCDLWVMSATRADPLTH